MKKAGFILTALVVQFCVTLSLGSVVAYASTHNRAPSGLIIWGRNFSGLNQAEVASELKAEIPKTVVYQGKIFPLRLERSYIKIDNWLNQVFPPTSGVWYWDVFQSLIHKPVLNPVLELDREDIVSQLKTISTQINEPMLPATISYENHHFIKIAGKKGQTLDIDATWRKIAANHTDKQVEAVVKDVPIQPATDQLNEVGDVLGDYTTYFNPEDISRTKNVRLAANAINNHLIAPGEVFSYNKVVGERTEAAGYLPAYIFVDSKEVKGDGGGVCQDSSTLFQAVRQANLKVEERHVHSLPVSYVSKGQDATVAYGLLDFRFQNNTKGYLLVSALTGENWLRIRLFGVSDANHPVQQPDGYPVRPDVFSDDFK
ncbi:putative vancomycin resistance protein [Desulfosporosinus acidiphilus SJ4]|uniref:Putative vancomycin resistance protein n=1 Tax=Desulfosporosinus acidiphilus (strain DSM 22704 / JCM 16185 / SJ4) TaxID=646529 RepID=I4D8E1_DESAJ|nr:VanW family protein [Desulfosporosinus acidiphilus]AFM42065.1 putative vancomycin resistance protein [Desulfosporosinus acidiphilus SJ4]